MVYAVCLIIDTHTEEYFQHFVETYFHKITDSFKTCMLYSCETLFGESDEDAETIRDKIKPIIPSNMDLVVAVLGRNWSSSNLQVDRHNWLKSRLGNG
jgi:hypothetical protein